MEDKYVRLLLHKADIEDFNSCNDIILKQSLNFSFDTQQAKK